MTELTEAFRQNARVAKTDYSPAELTAAAYRHWRAVGFDAAEALRLARLDALKSRKRYQEFDGWSPERPDNSGLRWVESAQGAGLRVVGYADEIVRLDHTGWFADSFQNSTVRGVVLQLPARNGRPVYLPAYKESENDGFRVDVSGLHSGPEGGEDNGHSDELRGVARAADRLAEKHAEQAREWDEAYQQGGQWAALKQEESEARAEILAMTAELRAVRREHKAGTTPHVCATLRNHIRDLYESIQKSRAERDKLTEWSAWAIRKYGEAFNNGAGETVFKGV